MVKHKPKKDDKPSDDRIIEQLKNAADAEDVFSATSDWNYDKLRNSVKSRGDFFDRHGSIVFEHEGEEVLSIPVSSLPITIGSGEKADCRLEFEGVSRVHCHLESIGSLVRICDDGSKNGVRLNGKKIIAEELCDGDELSIGSVSLRVKRG